MFCFIAATWVYYAGTTLRGMELLEVDAGPIKRLLPAVSGSRR